MGKILNLILRILVPLIIGLTIYLIKFSTNHQTGTIYISRDGLAPTTIYRDEYGIPHIKAEKFSDALYAMGRVHAEDRLWNMHVKRLLFAGRLSELFGSRVIVLDKYMRNLGILKTSMDNLEYLDATVKEYLQAYADGINDYVANLKILPIEFLITTTAATKLEPFTILDSLVFYKFLSFRLNFDWPYEILRADIQEIFGKEFASEVIPHEYEKMLAKSVVLSDEDIHQAGLYNEYIPQNIREKQFISKNATTFKEIDDIIETSLFDMLDVLSWGKGSNNWVISGNHTKSGKPLLANDPHLENNMPSIWLQVEIICGDINIIGASIPGLPVISIGRTKHFSYGLTTILADTSDLYEETLSEDGKQYLFDGNWLDVVEREEIIKIKG